MFVTIETGIIIQFKVTTKLLDSLLRLSLGLGGDFIRQALRGFRAPAI